MNNRVVTSRPSPARRTASADAQAHWNQYTSALRKAVLARKAAEAASAEPQPVAAPEPIRAKRGRNVAGSQSDAG